MTLQDYIQKESEAKASGWCVYCNDPSYHGSCSCHSNELTYSQAFTAGLSLASQAFEWASEKGWECRDSLWMLKYDDGIHDQFTTTELIESYLNNKEGK